MIGKFLIENGFGTVEVLRTIINLTSKILYRSYDIAHFSRRKKTLVISTFADYKRLFPILGEAATLHIKIIFAT